MQYFIFQCSVYECGEEEWNYKQMRKFNSKFGVAGQQFPCFYDPNAPNGVIVERTGFIIMVHGLLWPCACLIVGVFLWFGLCVGWWRLDNQLSEYEQYGRV